ncbi:putative adhesive plaque matrix protein [Triplophysa rosa]|uniref:Adhesive plaque matrix protein n=1 Tax=Triplophysa rosa TaxID=992332 RepID=A0A9W7WWS8_TRIRA|nr:putative adhesive plaque matrix protein [Triplophysa rosa]
MAFCKSLGNEFVILFAFSFSTFSTLIHCRSLLHLAASQTASDDGNNRPMLSDMSDQEGFYEQLSDFDYPIDDYISDLQRSAVETTSDEGEETLSDMSDQEGFYEQLSDFDYPNDDNAVSDLQRSAVIQSRLVSSSDVWDAISPKLRCGDDFMKLQLLGSDVDHVDLCRGSSAPVPLGHLPPDCGHTSPTHGGLVFETPYDGCGVAQQGGNYVMQMLLQGNPVVISCPMTPSVVNMTTSGYQPPRFILFNSFTPGSQKPQPPGYANMFWQYYYPPHHRGRPKPDPTSAPTTTSAVVYEPTQKPRPPGYPNMFWPYYYPHYNYHGRPKPTYKPVLTSAPTTTPAVADTPTQKPQLPANPHLFWPYYCPRNPMQPPKPQSPTVPPITIPPQPCTNPSDIQPYVEPRKFSSVLYEKYPFAHQYVDWFEHDP